MTSKKKMILLNGPSQVGKSEIESMVMDYVLDTHEDKNVLVTAFATPIKTHTIDVLLMNGTDLAGVEPSEDDVLYWMEPGNKDKACPFLDGMSVRDYGIVFAEEFMKPKFGRGVFGRHVKNEVRRNQYPDYVLVSDLGFKDELEEMRELKSVYDIYIVGVTRPGKVWNETRESMIDLANRYGFDTGYTINNDGSIEALHDKVCDMMEYVS